MNVAADIDCLTRAIDIQRGAIRLRLILATGVIVMGLAIIVTIQVQSGGVVDESLKWLLTLGGALVSTVSGFPLSEIATRRNKINLLKYLRVQFDGLRSEDAPGPPGNLEQLRARLIDILG